MINYEERILKEIRINALEGACMKDDEYIAATKKCVESFNALKKNLSKEQAVELFKYESDLAKKEHIMLSVISKNE